MNKKRVFIICGISAILITVVLIVFLKLKSGVFTSPMSKVQPTPAVIEEMETWPDPSEFSFQYPKSLNLNPHNEDQTNYAHVELTSATHSGNLIIWAKDTNTETIDAWVTQQKISNAIDTSLADIPAKKVLTTGDVNKLTIYTIQGGYLYQIETDLADNDFWNKIFNQVTSSFKFTTSDQGTDKQKSTGASDQSSDEGSTDGEEVIE